MRIFLFIFVVALQGCEKMTVSEACPIQFWPIGGQTFNEKANAYVDHQCFYQEFLIYDDVKLQVSNETNTDEKYWLQIKDSKGVQIDFKPFTKTIESGLAHYDITFDVSLLTSEDTYFRFYIFKGDVSVFDSTFDLTFTEPSLTTLYKSDLIKFSLSTPQKQGSGSFLIGYKSTKNFAGISYPNDGNYFYLRIPCRFFQERNIARQSALELSNSKVINTSVILKLQKLMTTTLMPDYMHNKLQLALAHGVRGSILIDGYEWTVEENYERNPPDVKSPFQFGKVWLTRKNHLVRNII